MSDALEPDDALTLLDWKRRVFDLYARVRASSEGLSAWNDWRADRDELFATHPQSPIPAPERATFEGLDYFEYDPAYRVAGAVSATEPRRYEIATSGDGSYAFARFGVVDFELAGDALQLELYWLEGYGGGLFLPFADATRGAETYGAGRYLFDTVKGADLGTTEAGLVLDFNFAYNPSCAYDPQWVCPLAPPPNRLGVRIAAGERSPK